MTSNRYPVAFLSVNIPPSFLDVNLEPNKTSVMLTNKDEVMTVLTNLVDEFYSDEKNKLPSNDNINGNNVAEKRIAVNGKPGDITNTCSLNGEVASYTASSISKRSNAQKTSLHLNRSSVLEDTQPQIILEHEAEHTCDAQQKTGSSASLSDNSGTGEASPSNKNCLIAEESSCSEEAVPASQECSSSSVVVRTVTADESGLCSSLQDNTSRVSPTDSLQSVELCESISDKTLCETSELTCHLENNLCNSLKESQGSSVVGNVNCVTGNSLSNLNSGACKPNENSASKSASSAENANVSNNSGTPQGNQELSKNRSLACNPTKSPSLENIFSLDMDNLFEDSDFDLSGINSNLKTPGSSNLECNSDKTRPESSVTVAVSSGTTEAPCSDKDWSMGRGILNKQGNPVQV